MPQHELMVIFSIVFFICSAIDQFVAKFGHAQWFVLAALYLLVVA